MKSKTPPLFSSTPAVERSLQRIWYKLYRAHDPPLQTLLMTSAVSGNGSTFVTASLACQVALAFQKKVLLIDLHPRHTNLRHMFDLPPTNGWHDYFSGNQPLEQCVRPTTHPAIALLSGPEQTVPFSSPETEVRIQTLLAEAKKNYGLTLLDAAPVLAYPETASMARLCDGCVLVIRADHTAVDDIRKACAELSDMGGNVVGTILNRKRRYLPKRLFNGFFGHDE